MRVVLSVSRAGPEGVFHAGDEIEVPDADGRRMIEAGQARPARRPQREKAVPKSQIEQAVP